MEGSEEEIGSTATTVQKMEERHKEALWDLFQSECSFLYDHLMVLKNVIAFRKKSMFCVE